jgi:quercetin 2,3-dioxygenase
VEEDNDGFRSGARGESGSAVQVATDRKPVRFLLVSGKPLKEPVAWYGPIVMNTRDELRTAFEEFERGTFVRHTGR